MKHIVSILVFLVTCSSAFAQVKVMTHTDSINALLPQTDISIDADSTIELPEGAFEVDEIAYTWMERQFLHIDENCISDSIAKFTPDSIYQMRLAALPTVIEMSWNHEVARCIDFYLNKRRKLIERMVSLGYNHYFPIYEEALQRHELPSELKYLSCIESGLRQNAYSPARAAGLWQFIPGTGMLQGLEINSYIDERYDVYKSTDAACRYLKGLYNKFGDWHLAIAAYNCGPGNVSKAMARSKGKTFWEIYNSLPRETRAYVPMYIAAVYVMTYHCEHNLCANLEHIPPTCDTIMLSKPVNFEQIATLIPNLTIEQVENLNPQYTHDIIPASSERTYALTLPSDKALTFIQNQDTITAWRADELLPHNGEWRDIKGRGRTNSYVRDGGNRLQDRNARNSKSKSKKGSSSSGEGGVYKVKKGDTLASIARKHGCTVAQLRKANGMKKNILRAGQKIMLP